MIRLQDPELKPSDDHSAWQESWNDDERLLACTAQGCWHDLIRIAQIKRLLLVEMPPEMRLRFLQTMNDRVHGMLTLEAMQCVKPACDTAMKMLAEMKSLHLDDQQKLMLRWNIVATFVNLNPSILDAIRLFDRRMAA
jgi:hypothetical protein